MSTALTKTLPQALPSAPLATAQQVRNTLEALRDVALVLTPTVVVDHIPAMHKVSIGVVLLNDRDIYGQGQRPLWLKEGERAIGKTGLLKIMAAGGSAMIENARDDDRKEPFVREWKVVLEVVQLDGKILPIIARRRMDFSDGSNDIKGFTASQVAEARKNIDSLCEAKCLTKAIKMAFQLEHKYPAAELTRPIIIPKLVPDLDTTDPIIRQMVAAKALGLTAQLYGPGQRAIEALPAHQLPAIAAPDDDEDSPSPETGTGPAAAGSTAGPVSHFPGDEMSDAQRRHLFALARELRIPSVKVPHPTGERTALAPDEKTMQALGLKGFVVVADLNMDAAANLIDRMAKLAEVSGHHPADDPPPPLSDEPMHVCACPCGCQKEIGAEQAQATRDNVGAPRCRACYPGRSFELSGHEVLASLGLPKYPNLTPAAADEWSRKQRGAA